MRHDRRNHDQLRSLKIERYFTRSSAGSVLISAGRTTVLCTASIVNAVPKRLDGTKRGWVTAEYAMLAGSTNPRGERDPGKVDGRATEIRRLIGRSLRAVVDFEALGERSIYLDCTVLEADGGTRTTSITGSLVALIDAVNTLKDLPKYPLRDSVAAISVGILDGEAVLDLDYFEDEKAAVDMNVVATGNGPFVEIQGTAEKSAFDDGQLAAMLALARGGLESIREIQREALGQSWPF